MMHEFFGNGRVCLVAIPDDLLEKAPLGRAGFPLARWAVQAAQDARVTTAPTRVLRHALRGAGRRPGASDAETRARAVAWAATGESEYIPPPLPRYPGTVHARRRRCPKV